MVENFAGWTPLRGAQARPPLVLFGLAVAWLLASALALGSAPYWFAVAVLSFVQLSALFVFGELRRGWSLLSTLLLGLALFSAIQLIPLPLYFLDRVSPTVASIWRGAAKIPGLDGPPRYGSITLDAGATALEVLKWSTYAIVSAAGGRLSKTVGLGAILGALGAVGTTLSLVGFGHVLTSAQRVFGLYAPIAERTVTGPLINPNHFATYANLAAFSCAGLALSNARRRVRLASGWAVAVNVLACFVSASRGGVTTLLVGLGALLVWNEFSRRKQPGRIGGIPLLLIYGVLIGLGGFSLTSGRSHELLNGDLSKLALLPTALDAARDSWLFGVGRGAFDSVSFRYFPSLGPIVLRSIESFPLSFLVEWGAPVTATALVSLGFLLRPSRVRAGENVRRTSAWLAICAVSVQNLADIGLELPSLSLAVWTLAGALAMSPKPERGHSSLPRSALRWSGAASAVGLGVLGALLSLTTGPDAFGRRRELHARYVARDAGFRALAGRAMLAYPADPYFPFLVGVDVAGQGGDALAFGALALGRAPAYGPGHFLVGRALLARGAREQAILEFRLAMQSDRGLIVDGVRAGLVAARTEEQIERLIPTGANRPAVLFELFRLLSDSEWPALRRRVLREANALMPTQYTLAVALLFELTADLKRGTTPCSEGERGRCPLVGVDRLRAELEQHLTRLSERNLGSCAPIRVRAALLELDGRGREGEQLLARECSACWEAGACVKDRLGLADRLGDFRVVEEAELAFHALSCDSAESCAHSEEHLAERARAQGEVATAAKHLFKAAAQSPSGTRWLAAARAYLVARSFGQATAAYDRARALGAADPVIEAQLSQLRRESLRDLLQKDRLKASP